MARAISSTVQPALSRILRACAALLRSSSAVRGATERTASFQTPTAASRAFRCSLAPAGERSPPNATVSVPLRPHEGHSTR